jgi:hypothetical protein
MNEGSWADVEAGLASDVRGTQHGVSHAGMDALTPLLIQRVCLFLTAADATTLASVSRSMSHTARADPLWAHLISREPNVVLKRVVCDMMKQQGLRDLMDAPVQESELACASISRVSDKSQLSPFLGAVGSKPQSPNELYSASQHPTPHGSDGSHFSSLTRTSEGIPRSRSSASFGSLNTLVQPIHCREGILLSISLLRAEPLQHRREAASETT